MSSDKDNFIGVHTTGIDGYGDKLLKEGIELTGHKYVAGDYERYNYKNGIKVKLANNIHFFNNEPIGVIIQLMNARDYNAPVEEFNDMMIVSIPKQELEQNKEGIIIEKNESIYLNPTYIKGYAKVGVQKGNIENFIDNPSFIEKGKQKQTVQELSTDDWKNKFEGWYENSRTTKLQKIKNKVMGFFKSILNKEKDKESQKDTEQYER